MLNLTNYQLLRGINPNLAAGQRSYIVSEAARAGAYIISLPHNASFYNFGSGPFTIYARFLLLGQDYFDGGSTELALLTKAANGTGWTVLLAGDAVAGAPVRPQIKFTNGGYPFGVRSNTPWPLDGYFHSVCFTRRTFTDAEAGDLNNIKMFVDGIEVSNRENFNVPQQFDNANDLRIGGISGRYLRGYLDCVSFYNVGLSDLEIATLDNTGTRTDRGAKFIQDYNQLNGSIILDSTSVGQNATSENSALYAGGRGFVRTDGIRTFRKNSVLLPPLNGHFMPTRREVVTGISRYDSQLSGVQYSLDNVNWFNVAFDTTGMSAGFTPITVGPDLADTTLYLRATNANASYLNALELHY